MKNKFKLFFILLLAAACLFETSVFGQTSDKDWTALAFNNELIYIDLSNITSFTSDDLYIWVSEKHAAPISLEPVKKDIYKTQTYYLINKELKRYSIQEILYFDKQNKVIQNFSYEVTESELPDMKYNYPIIQGSMMDMILQRCLTEIERSNEEVR